MPNYPKTEITDEHIRAFIAEHEDLWAPKNAHNAGLRLHVIDAWLTERCAHGLVEATPAELTEYRKWALREGGREGQPLHPATVTVHIRYLKAFYRWAKDHRPLPWDDEVLVARNPAAGLKAPKGAAAAPERKPVATDEQYLALMRTTTKAARRAGKGYKDCNNLRDAAIIALLYETGVRREELVFIEHRYVDLAERTIFLAHTKSRGQAKPRTIRFGAHTAAALGAYQRSLPFGRNGAVRLFTTSTNRPISANAVSLMLRRRLEMAGLDRAELKHWGAHSFRRKLANDWLTDGGPVEELETVMGWKHDNRMASQYAEQTQTTRALSAAEAFHQRRAGRTLKAVG